MKFFPLILTLVSFLRLSAQEPTALTVKNLKVDLEKLTVDFDVLNQSAKPVHVWTMTIATTKKKPSGQAYPFNGLTTSESCSRGTAVTLNPAQSRRCKIDAEYNEPGAALLEAGVRITAVLFEDGTAEGDLRLLDSTIEQRRMTLRALQFWQGRFQDARKGASPINQLKAFAKMLVDADPGIPRELLYDRSAILERESLATQVSNSIQQVESGGMTASAMVSFLTTMLQQRVEGALKANKAFPPTDKPFAPSTAAVPTHAITNRTSRFQVVSLEEQNDRLRVVLRNDYDKEIVEYALIQRRPSGDSMGVKDVRGAAVGQAIAAGAFTELTRGVWREGDPPLELACVIFRDGTGDGDPATVRKLTDRWAGERAETARVVPLLRAIAQLPEAERTAAIDTLIADLQAGKPEAPPAGYSGDFVMGLQQKRQVLIGDLQSLRGQQPSAYNTELTSLIARYEPTAR